jgi:hypothetical protein
MVRETGDATEKFLRSIAAGDEEAQRELHDAAAAALVNLSVPCSSAEPACLAALAANLSQNAAQLNQQVNGLLQLLQTQAHGALDTFRIGAYAEQQAQVSGGSLGGSNGIAVPSSTHSQPHAAQLGSLPAAGNSTSAGLETAVGDSSAATMQQLKAALAATSQLQLLAHAVQQLVDSGAGTASAVGAVLAHPGSGAAAEEHTADGVRRSNRQDELQEGLTGSNSTFAELLQQQMSGAASGSAEPAATAAAAAAGVEAVDVLGVGGSVAGGQGSSTAQHAAIWVGAATESISASFARAQGRDSLAQAGRSSQFLRRLSLEVNPIGNRRAAASRGSRTSVDMVTQQQQQQQ